MASAASGSIRVELSYWHTGAGEIGIEVGDIVIVRYREDGTRRDIPVRIDETSADYRTHSLLAALRVGF